MCLFSLLVEELGHFRQDLVCALLRAASQRWTENRWHPQTVLKSSFPQQRACNSLIRIMCYVLHMYYSVVSHLFDGFLQEDVLNQLSLHTSMMNVRFCRSESCSVLEEFSHVMYGCSKLLIVIYLFSYSDIGSCYIALAGLKVVILLPHYQKYCDYIVFSTLLLFLFVLSFGCGRKPA